jgi:SAM-dependent methyltransferase
MVDWDERYRTGRYPKDPDPSPLLESHVSEFPDGRALDLAAGSGRNAVFLARRGYTVDAIDQSREGLALARENAARHGVAGRLNLLQADVPSFRLPVDRYAVATVSFYRAVDRFPDIEEALETGGYLFVEHHLRSADPTPVGPDDDRYRFAANELLHASLDLTVLHYDEKTEERPDGRQSATARILARKTSGPRQSYPRRRDRW